jgi:large subunit ribosomal protein L13
MNKKTTAVKLETLVQDWHFIDAKDRILGKVAEEIARALMGKDKAIFSNNANVGDKVVVINAEKFVVTGKKMVDKKYIWYTGFPGGLRTQSLQDKLAKNPTQVIQAAVKGMLPKNRLQKIRMANLYIYAGTEHPHTAQMTKLEKAKA